MAVEFNYLLIWIIYLTAGAIFYCIFWRATRSERANWGSYSIRAVVAAIILTPWYANAQGDTMAPALMVMTLDLITIGTDSVVRGAIPIALSVIAAEIAASGLYLIAKRKSNSKNNI